MRLRIVHAIPNLGGGGAEIQLAYLAAAQRRAGDDVHVMLAGGGIHAEKLEAAGVEMHFLRNRGNSDPSLVVQSSRLARRLAPDLLQTWLPQMDVVGGVAALACRIPWLVSERSERSYPPNWKNALRSWLGRRADGIVANSVAGAEYWKDRLKATAPVWIIPNAVPREEIARAIPASDGILPAKPGAALFLFVGRLHPDKNVENLIRAVAIARRKISLEMVLCGVGPWEEHLRRFVLENALSEAVRFAGYVTRIWPWMKRADALALVSRAEGEPNAVLEAVACGCPLVLSDIPSHRVLLGARGALYVDPESPDSIADGLVRAIADRPEAAARAEAARECLENRSVESIASRYREVYETLLRGRGGRRCAG